MKRIISVLVCISILGSSLLFMSCNNTANGSDTTSSVEATNPDADGTTCGDVTTVLSADATTDETTTADANKRDPNKEIKILFVGNSFTFYNDMPTAIFEKICTSAGYKVKVDSVTNGGHYLSEFADISDSYGLMVRSRLKKTKYDVVILQEQSGCAIKDPGRFYDGVRGLSELIKQNGAEIWLYETWGYKAGYSKLPTHGGDTATMEMKLRAAYTAIAEEVGASVSLVGTAMLDVHTNNTSFDVYNSDLFHPSVYGSTVAAFTLFASIFNEDPREVEFNGSVSSESASIIKEAAYKAVFNDNPVADEYKTSSVGVTSK